MTLPKWFLPGRGRSFVELLLGMGAIVLIYQISQMFSLPPPPGWLVLRPPYDVAALVERGPEIWAGGARGLVCFDRHSGRPLPLPLKAPRFRDVRDLAVGADDQLWIAHRDGLTRLRQGRWESILSATETGAGMAVCVAANGAVWLGTDRGAYRYDGHAIRHFTTADGLAALPVQTIFEDQSGRLWFGSSEPTAPGLSSFDGQSWRQHAPAPGFPDNTVTALAQEADGALWVATGYAARGAASRLEQGQWTSWTNQTGLPPGRVRSAFVDRQDRLWLGFEYMGLVVREGIAAQGAWKPLTAADGLPGWEVKQVLEDADGQIWIGTEHGLARLTARAVETVLHPDGRPTTPPASSVGPRPPQFLSGMIEAR